MSVATGNKVKLLKMEELRPSTKKMNFRQAAIVIYQTEGAAGFLRGLTPSLIKNSLMTG